MLTKNDIEILKEIFVTKDEYRRGTDSILKEIRGMVEMLGAYIHRTESLEQEVKNHRTILNIHEQKLQKII